MLLMLLMLTLTWAMTAWRRCNVDSDTADDNDDDDDKDDEIDDDMVVVG